MGLAHGEGNAQATDGFVPMFDGKTLAGWQTTGNWVVEDGVVTLRPREGEKGWQRYDAYLTTEGTKGTPGTKATWALQV